MSLFGNHKKTKITHSVPYVLPVFDVNYLRIILVWSNALSRNYEEPILVKTATDNQNGHKQETWLLETELCVLNSIDEHFYGIGISSVDISAGLLRGSRPYGGLAILYCKTLSLSVKIINYHDKRIFGLEVACKTLKLLIINVYFPYESHNNFDEFMNYLGKVYSIIHMADTPYVLVMGDMDANTYMYSERNRVSVFGEELVKFCNEYSLILSDVSKLGCSENIYTHYSDAHHSVSWRDHCISTVNAHRLINYVHISDTVIVSDHLP